MIRAWAVPAVLALGVATTGCYKTRYELTPPPTTTPPPPIRAAGQHFHLALFNIFELSAPINLVAECGGEVPVAVDERVGILGGLVNKLLSDFLPILHVHNATVGCAPGVGPMLPPTMSPTPVPAAVPPSR